MTDLPYGDSKTDPIKAQQRIRQTLMKFGVDRLAFNENFNEFQVAVQFEYNGYPVDVPLNYKDLAEKFVEKDPWTSKKRCSEDKWNEKKRETAYNASFAVLEDFIKSVITFIDLGVITFEEAFFAHFIGADGERFGKTIIKELPKLIKGQVALKDNN